MPPEVWRCPGGLVRHSAARTRCSYLSFFASFIDGVLLFLNHICCKSVNLDGGVHHNGASCPSPPFNCGPRPDGGLAYPSVYPPWPAWLPIQRGWPLNADGLSSMEHTNTIAVPPGNVPNCRRSHFLPTPSSSLRSSSPLS